MEKKLTAREELFCRLESMLGNPREAAVQAGYPADTAATSAARLLRREDIQKERTRLERERLPESARRGLERIAFGSVNDAVQLLFEEQPSSERLAALDLFAVSEIKRPKGGGLEIKFHSRLEALKALAELSGSERENGVGALCRALGQGARELRSSEPDED